ncbi:hypothetical protein Nstercoris_01464 [Nitrosomonas stercoris]|uniref:Uncharacterized protein n=1 Tax=Nitrosomonas stercoris TaxID=1444684 RepID=A0A4Y1YM34_9PROT|nr:hypothetical protein Nstercoris_01464 [Nitrosomonas stercoris]
MGLFLLSLLFAEYFSNSNFVNGPLLAKNITYFSVTHIGQWITLSGIDSLLPEVSGHFGVDVHAVNQAKLLMNPSVLSPYQFGIVRVVLIQNRIVKHDITMQGRPHL